MAQDYRNDPRRVTRQNYGRPFGDRSSYSPGAVAGPHSGVHPGTYREDRDASYRQDSYSSGWQGDGGDRSMWDRAADEVSSWFGDDAAQARRQDDHRGRGPRDYTRSDERILEDVNERLTDDPDLDATDIRVSVSEREVSLDGEVASRLEKRRAEDCAEDVSGVAHVQNNLRIRTV
jgi:osmotically-inducible protein OsmY